MKKSEHSLGIVLAAGEAAGCRALRRLASSPHRVVAVLTPEPAGAGGVADTGSVWRLAIDLGLHVLPPRILSDAGAVARLGSFDLLLNVHSLQIIAEPVLQAARIGAFNLHPGPLPRYAGLNAPSWALYRGEPEHGVTLHWMEAGVDTGDIAYQHMFPVRERDTGLALSTACARHGLTLLDRLLCAATGDPDAIPRQRQDLSSREYFGREVPEAGILRWDRPAQRILNAVRAFDYHPYPSPWGRLRADLQGRTVGIIKARRTQRRAGGDPGTVAVTGDGSGLMVAASDEWIELTLLEIDGKITRAATLVAGDRVRIPSAA